VRTVYDDWDVSQLVFLDLFRREVSTDAFRSSGRLSPFLLAVARNKIRQLHRQELDTRKRCRDRVGPLEDDIPDHGPRPDVLAAVEDEWHDLLRRLPPLWRRVLAMLREGHTRDEVACLKRVSLSTIDRVVRGARDVVLGRRLG
jgi:DNA-directed RNA polymerase specialized sigma24 family protein